MSFDLFYHNKFISKDTTKFLPSLLPNYFVVIHCAQNCPNFLPAAGIYWLIKLPVLPLTSVSKCHKKLSQMSTFITKSFLGHSTSKNHGTMEIFACGGHLLAHKTTSSALNSQFQSAMKKLPQMSTIITKSFLDHSSSKNFQNFSPAAGIYWLIKLPVLLLTPIFKVP